MKILPFKPDDLSHGKVLQINNGEIIEEDSLISSVISLYFQMNKSKQENSTYLNNSNSKEQFNGELFYDEEDSNPEELFFNSIDNSKISGFKINDSIELVVELFGVGYVMNSKIIGLKEDDWDPADIILSWPENVHVVKNRIAPRHTINKSNKTNLDCTFPVNNEPHNLPVIEFTTTNIVVQSNLDIDVNGSCELNGVNFNYKVIKKREEISVLKLDLSEEEMRSKYLRLYLGIKYPFMKVWGPEIYDLLPDLFKETGYIKNFDMGINDYDRLKQMWTVLDSDESPNTVQMAIVDNDGKLSGSSSLAKSFVRDGVDTWVFHQLCSKREPDLLDRSGALYRWRLEYLTAIENDYNVVCWFQSKSRWIEKIYIKFYRQMKKESLYQPVRLARKKFKRKKEPNKFTEEIKQFKWGDFIRPYWDGGQEYGSLAPFGASLSGGIDHLIFPLEESIVTENDIEELAGALLNSADIEEMDLFVTLPKDSPLYKDENHGAPDRMFLFNHKGVKDFITSLDHTIWVTKKKYGI